MRAGIGLIEFERTKEILADTHEGNHRPVRVSVCCINK